MDINIPDITLAELPAIATLADLVGAYEARRIASEIRAMERMTPDERVAAAHRGSLRGPALRAWASSRPHELENTSLAVDEDGPDGMPFVPVNHDGEFPWILHHSVDYGDEVMNGSWRLDGRAVSEATYRDSTR